MWCFKNHMWYYNIIDNLFKMIQITIHIEIVYQLHIAKNLHSFVNHSFWKVCRKQYFSLYLRYLESQRHGSSNSAYLGMIDLSVVENKYGKSFQSNIRHCHIQHIHSSKRPQNKKLIFTHQKIVSVINMQLRFLWH